MEKLTEEKMMKWPKKELARNLRLLMDDFEKLAKDIKFKKALQKLNKKKE